MTETPTITTERVDDIPLLLAMMKQMGLPALLDSNFPTHGNWQGLSPAWTTCIWLTHVLSQADHRLSYVQPWVEAHLSCLQQASGQAVRPLDFSDDRLASLLRHFSDDYYWQGFETSLNRNLLRVYDLRPERVRLDSTTASGYWGVDGDGLFQFGPSKDKRPDLAQLKVMLATLDPIPLPLLSTVLPGQAADDPLYCPAIEQVRCSVGRGGLLYVGDCKMAAHATRAYVQAGRDYYLCPLPAKQLPADWPEQYLAAVLDGRQPVQPVVRQRADGEAVEIARGYERTVEMQATVDGWEQQWPERHLVVRSVSMAQSAERGLRQRLAAAQTELRALTERRRGKKRLRARAAVEQAIATILARREVGGLLRVELAEQRQQRHVRSYKGAAARVEEHWEFSLSVEEDQAAVAAAVARLGWRVYATNQPAESLSLAAAVLYYREEYLIEQSIGRLKGAPLSLRPFYLQRDDHAKGLVRLLLMGLRVLCLVEWVVRRQLAAAAASLSGLYAGQPKASTQRPSAERLLGRFKELTLTRIEQAGQVYYHLTPLSALQQRILTLLGFSPDIYTQLAVDLAQPP
jgi:transposase